MSEMTYTRCQVCQGTLKIKPENKPEMDCPVCHETPGFAKTGVTLGQISKLVDYKHGKMRPENNGLTRKENDSEVVSSLRAGFYCCENLSPSEDDIQTIANALIDDLNLQTAEHDGATLISMERRRQVMEEGWTPEHDDQWQRGELIDASIEYAVYVGLQKIGREHLENFPTESWPWLDKWWKPSDDPIRNLEKAGALIAAEIDRLKREKG